MVVAQHDHVGAGAGLNARGDARLQVIGVDGLELDLDTELLFSFGKQLGLEYGIAGGNEVIPAQNVHFRRALRDGRHLDGRHDGGHASGGLQELASIDLGHRLPSLGTSG